MPSLANPRLRLDVDGEVEFLIDVQGLIDQALALAELAGQIVEFDVRFEGKAVLVQVRSNSPRDWLINACSAVFSGDSTNEVVGPYPERVTTQT